MKKNYIETGTEMVINTV